MLWNEGYRIRIRELRATIEALQGILHSMEARNGHTWGRDMYADYEDGIDIADKELRNKKGA